MAVRINVEIDSKELILRLDKGQRRLAFAAVNAINKTALRIQEGVRAGVRERFTVRKAEFIRREAAKISFASISRGQAFAEIFVGQKSRLLLSQFEAGGVREPFKGKRGDVAVPFTGSAARPSFSVGVPRPYLFSRLRFTKTRPLPPPKPGSKRRRKRSRKSKAGIRYGRQRSYWIPGVGAFRRVSSTETELIYSLVQRPQLEPDLQFVQTAESIAALWLPEELQRETIEAIGRGS